MASSASLETSGDHDYFNDEAKKFSQEGIKEQFKTQTYAKANQIEGERTQQIFAGLSVLKFNG